MTIGIYKLEFSNNSFYIGQSVDIEKRYKSHLYCLKNNTGSVKLQEAYNTYGIPDLSILIECTEEELDANEVEAIEIYDAVYSGLNHSAGGLSSGNMCGLYSYTTSMPKDTYINILKELVSGYNTCETIAKNNNVSIDIVLQISSLKSHSWLSEECPEEYKILENIYLVGRRNYFSKLNGAVLIGPNNEKVVVSELHTFCKKYNLVYASMYNVIRGAKLSNKGWRLEGTMLKTYPKIIDPSGIEYQIDYGKAKAFALEHGLNPASLTKLLAGTAKIHKGWKLKDAIN